MDTMFSVPKYEEFRLIGIFAGLAMLAMLCSFSQVSIYASDTTYVAKKTVVPMDIDTQGVKEKIFKEFSPELKKKEFCIFYSCLIALAFVPGSICGCIVVLNRRLRQVYKFVRNLLILEDIFHMRTNIRLFLIYIATKESIPLSCT